MINNININTTRESFQNTLEQINLQVDEIRQAYSDPIDGILKYTTDGRCITFFGDIPGPVRLEEIQQQEQQIGCYSEKIQMLLSFLEKQDNIPHTIIEIYRRSLYSLDLRFEMFRNALRIEAEKSGYPLTDEQRNYYYTNVQKIQKQIYGERVSDTLEEVSPLLEKLHTLYNTNKDNISLQEQDIFSTFLQNLDDTFGYSYQKFIIHTPSKSITASTHKEHIDPQELTKLSQEIIDFYKHLYKGNTEMQKRKVQKDDNISSINVSGLKEELNIPSSYKNVDAEKIAGVIASHEIEQHLLQRTNTNTFLGKGFSSGKYDFVSEGLAKVNEDIGTGKINSIQDLQHAKENFSIGALGVFICENYNYQDAVRFLKIYKKLSTPEISDVESEKFAITAVKRRKRFVPYQLPGSSIKDTLYQRGKNWVIDYLTQDTPESLTSVSKRYQELSSFKFGPEEVSLIPEIKQELGIDDKQLIYPSFIGRILYDKLQKGKGSAKEYPLGNVAANTITNTSKKEIIAILQGIKEAEQS